MLIVIVGIKKLNKPPRGQGELKMKTNELSKEFLEISKKLKSEGMRKLVNNVELKYDYTRIINNTKVFLYSLATKYKKTKTIKECYESIFENYDSQEFKEIAIKIQEIAAKKPLRAKKQKNMKQKLADFRSEDREQLETVIRRLYHHRYDVDVRYSSECSSEVYSSTIQVETTRRYCGGWVHNDREVTLLVRNKTQAHDLPGGKRVVQGIAHLDSRCIKNFAGVKIYVCKIPTHIYSLGYNGFHLQKTWAVEYGDEVSHASSKRGAFELAKKKERAKRKKIKNLDEVLKKSVTLDDAREAGLCEQGTRAWLAQHMPEKLSDIESESISLREIFEKDSKNTDIDKLIRHMR